MKKNSKFIWGLIALVILFVGIVVAVQLNRDPPVKVPEHLLADKEPEAPKRVVAPSQSLEDALGLPAEDFVVVGGVKRPKRDIETDKVNLLAARERYLKALPDVGQAPLVKPDANPVVKKLFEELSESSGAHVSQSTLYRPKNFDRAAYKQDPEAYLSLIRPGRVFQSAQPGAEGVSRLSSKSPGFQRVLQGETVVLEVTGEPGMPITFHTQQLGEFENRLKTMTVAASEQGVAKARYKATTGVVGLVNILAASPVSSGQLKFMVDVKLANQLPVDD